MSQGRRGSEHFQNCCAVFQNGLRMRPAKSRLGVGIRPDACPFPERLRSAGCSTVRQQPPAASRCSSEGGASCGTGKTSEIPLLKNSCMTHHCSSCFDKEKRKSECCELEEGGRTGMSVECLLKYAVCQMIICLIFN